MDLASPWGKAGHSKRVQGVGQFPAVEPGPNAVWLPNGMCISYPNLRSQSVLTHTGQTQPEIVYDLPYGGVAKLYGGKITENIDQALSRIVITDIIERVRASTGYQPFLSTYDSIDYCVPEGEAKDFDKRLEHEFAIPPSWAPNLPLASEGGYGISLLKAEHGENL